MSAEVLQASALRTLILSDNPGLTGDVQAIKGPLSLQSLHISNTSISGSFDAGWMTRQSPQLTCLVAYNTPALCGQLDNSLPCSLTYYTQGTALSECTDWTGEQSAASLYMTQACGCGVVHQHAWGH